MQRFQKLVLMSEKAAERTRIIVQKVYWASRDALHYNTATAMAYQELEVLSTVPLEGGEKSNEEITAIHQQMLDIIQRCLECRTKSIKEEQNVEALVISAIQYFEEEWFVTVNWKPHRHSGITRRMTTKAWQKIEGRDCPWRCRGEALFVTVDRSHIKSRFNQIYLTYRFSFSSIHQNITREQRSRRGREERSPSESLQCISRHNYSPYE